MQPQPALPQLLLPSLRPRPYPTPLAIVEERVLPQCSAAGAAGAVEEAVAAAAVGAEPVVRPAAGHATRHPRARPFAAAFA